MDAPSALREPAAPSRDGERGGHRVYRAGSLRYTLGGLAFLFLWLLWGDFAFTFFENVFGRFLPLYLKDLDASNTLIGVMTGSIAGVVNVLFLPHISRWSDGCRSCLGRRIPFLYVVTPVTVLFLVGIGYAPEIAARAYPWLHARVFSHLAPEVTAGGAVLAFLSVLVVGYHFFNMVLVNAYNWLIRDVVPEEVMARFLSWFRIVSTASSFAFLWWVFPHLKEYRKEIFLGIGLFYIAAFLLMCRCVKEGAYPPPPPKEDRPGLAKAYLLFFRECFALPIYRYFFIGSLSVVLAMSCPGSFFMLFTRNTLGLDMDSIGKIFAWSAAASMVIYFPMGWLCDRLNPLRVTLAGLAGLVAMSVLGWFVVRGRESFLAWTLVQTVPAAAWALGSLAASMRLFPKEKFGQFYSGLNIFGCGALIVGNYAVGKFMDFVHSDYRTTFLWSALFYAVAAYPFCVVYREWKRHGGAAAYVAPLPPAQA
ncbi:MAG TPA: MFS transporter [Candidatus Methylacidiphilales bacterium]